MIICPDYVHIITRYVKIMCKVESICPDHVHKYVQILCRLENMNLVKIRTDLSIVCLHQNWYVHTMFDQVRSIKVISGTPNVPPFLKKTKKKRCKLIDQFCYIIGLLWNSKNRSTTHKKQGWATGTGKFLNNTKRTLIWDACSPYIHV